MQRGDPRLRRCATLGLPIGCAAAHHQGSQMGAGKQRPGPLPPRPASFAGERLKLGAGMDTCVDAFACAAGYSGPDSHLLPYRQYVPSPDSGGWSKAGLDWPSAAQPSPNKLRLHVRSRLAVAQPHCCAG